MHKAKSSLWTKLWYVDREPFRQKEGEYVLFHLLPPLMTLSRRVGTVFYGALWKIWKSMRDSISLVQGTAAGVYYGMHFVRVRMLLFVSESETIVCSTRVLD